MWSLVRAERFSILDIAFWWMYLEIGVSGLVNLQYPEVKHVLKVFNLVDSILLEPNRFDFRVLVQVLNLGKAYAVIVNEQFNLPLQ